MGRVLWIVGEVMVGVLVSGGIAGVIVASAARMGWATGPWMTWPVLVSGILLSVIAGERLRRSLKSP